MNEGPYRHPHPHPGPPPVQYQQGIPPYHHQQQQQPQMPPYGDHYSQMPASRGPPQENMGVMEGGLAPLAPGIQPAKPEPLPRACIENGRKYELVVIQQPRRARMCGFGDKDRRPITPPPCVRLIITDCVTGKEIDCNDIDHGMFVLNVDLWSSDGQNEVNLVRHSNQSPSISNSIALSYAETKPIYATIQPQQQQQFKNEPSQGPQQGGGPYNPYPQHGPPQVSPYAQSQGHPQHHGQYAQPAAFAPHDGHPHYPPQNGGYQGPPQQGQQQMYVATPLTGAQIHAQGHAGTLPPQPEYNGQQVQQVQQQQQPFRQPHNPAQPQGMFTRNLIGSLAASAFRLTDTDDRIGIWFVLQDLSVRTEGHFRLRFSFVNVGAPTSPTSVPKPPNGANGINTTAVNTGKAPILAACFSEVFTVYSAKKFPGVVESTPLSKCFATQGIKIPIRKDGPGGEKSKKGGDFDDDD